MAFSAELFSTTAVRGGLRPDPTTGAVLTPIYQSTTYHQEAVGVHKGFTYSRAANPTVSALESALGALEDTPPAVCFSSGMAAISALFFATLKAGDHVVVSDVVYGGTVRLFQQILTNFGVEASFVDTADPQAVAQAIQPNTRLVFIETPANPTLKLTDIAAIANVAHAAGVRLAVDNTFLTPALQRPLDLGADISLLSTTKYIEGHNSTVGGSIATRDQALIECLRVVRKTLGCIQSPQESWLTLRGLKTLPLRLQQHSTNAQKVAEWLEQHAKVARVHFPGLATFPQFSLAEKQQALPGGILSFELKGGANAGIQLMNTVRLCLLAENLGAVETLITHPVSMTHGDVPREIRERTGVTDGLVRLSVGLENPADIIADLESALTAIEITEPKEEVCLAK
ncbi:MAG TPA: aminotransferase class I/II-fold pyridoxal phosphate-dependent enzyme [Verrucomicrobiae bacterium]|jgi:cystathionine beta-lyase/cystathionine gamma-synthase|nr:aminotransferase class I/II-fold pyridoxal phosphate-dependent enzyme [Verrucomicrobiae bacterium]